MSSILKALKKVEEEKAAQRTAAPLAGDVARSRRSRQRKSPWKIVGVLASVALLAVLTTFAAMGGFSGGKRKNASSPTVNPAATAGKEAASPVAVQVPSAPIIAVPEKGTAQPVAASVKTLLPAKTVQPPGVPVTAVPAVAVKTGTQPFLRTTTGIVSIGEDHAGFKVSGIAWQKESLSRLAVVNGLAVTQGATVDGAKVVEILPDRVRLSQGGRIFEVLLGRINHH
jgi:general secretion pathway protein B